MKSVLVTRFEPEDLMFIEQYSRTKDVDKSAAIRELYKYGRCLLGVKMYESKKASLGKASELAGMSIGEFMNVLEELKIPTTVTTEDVLEGYNNLKQLSSQSNKATS